MVCKQKIQEIIVVEGKTDTTKLQSLFEVDTIETHGSFLSRKTIELIKQGSLKRGVILFLDPDGPGESIRRKLENVLINFKEAFISKSDILNKKKIGIAEAKDQAIIDALKSIVTFNKNNSSLSWSDYLSLNLVSKEKRRIITEHYKISECNNKQLFKRLNMMMITIDDLKKVI